VARGRPVVRRSVFGGGRTKAPCGEILRVTAESVKGEGGSVVEYGIVVMMLMTMLLGIVDFSRALYSYHFVSHAAREATRWAAVNGATCRSDNSCNGEGYMNNGPATQAAIQNYVKGMTPLGIVSSQVTTTASWPGNGTGACPAGSEEPTCPVEVQVSYNFHFFFWFVSKKTLTLSSTSQMVISH
jgi:Flp pilus assembly protein TadG